MNHYVQEWYYHSATNQSFKEHPSRKIILFSLQNRIKILRGSTFTVEWQALFLHSNICYTKWKKSSISLDMWNQNQNLNNYHTEKQFISLNSIFILSLTDSQYKHESTRNVCVHVCKHIHTCEGTYLTRTVSLRLSLTGDRSNIHFTQTSSILHI